MSVYHFFSNYHDNSCDNDALIFDMHNVTKMTSQCYHSIITKRSMKYQNINVWFQKISIPPPQRELEIPEGRRVGQSILFPDVLQFNMDSSIHLAV